MCRRRAGPRVSQLLDGVPPCLWFLGEVKDVTSVDMSAPPESPLPHVLVDWTS